MHAMNPVILPLLLLLMLGSGHGAVNPCSYIRGITGLNFFESQHSSGQWVVMNCAQGSAYNGQTCSCSDYIFRCQLYATSNVKEFAYIINGVIQYKTCPFDTVYKADSCGCY
uniref:Uncharacterized protein LOC111121767 n=1 Tax=Crassostrea virginica TaxID=6565 RepID=A0A8B8CT56_CRAVI|nr:uncharacterized protein LOC111121767 [Crassostrea virginica]